MAEPQGVPMHRGYDHAMKARFTLVWFCGVIGLAFLSPAGAGQYGQYGPFDYYDTKNTPTRAYALVERAHLGPKTELLRLQGDQCFYWGDLDYTLRAFPNHPKALVKMAEFLKGNVPCSIGGPASEARSAAELAEQLEAKTWQGRTMEYYFETAIRYRPQYVETRLLYARALKDVAKNNEAIRVLQEAIHQDPKSAMAHYELGSLLLTNGEKQAALVHAQKAYGLGAPPSDLRDKLVAAGLWK